MALVDVGQWCWPAYTLSSNPQTYTLDADEEHGAAVFVVPKTGTLKKIG